jgi:hypothetical protein
MAGPAQRGSVLYEEGWSCRKGVGPVQLVLNKEGWSCTTRVGPVQRGSVLYKEGWS